MNPNQKLPRQCIIKNNDAFREVIERGRVWRGKWIKIFFLESDREAVGFSVPKKFGNAVMRNRAKRWMREAYRKHRIEFQCRRLVMIPKIGWDLIKYQDLEKEVLEFLKRIQKVP